MPEQKQENRPPMRRTTEDFIRENRAYTVGELITALESYPHDMRVMRRGYEGGYDDLCCPEKQRVALCVNTRTYYGPHGDDGDCGARDENTKIIDAVIV